MVTNKVVCSREIQRVIDSDGLIVAAGIRNGMVEPQERYQTMPYHTYGELLVLCRIEFSQMPMFNSVKREEDP